MSNTKQFRLFLAATFFFGFAFLTNAQNGAEDTNQKPRANLTSTYLGFDVNAYPGDAALPSLKQTFAFAGYWLNVPPGAKENNWGGKRAQFVKSNFGFLVLFNGRLERELTSAPHAAELAAMDGKAAVAAARREGFPSGTIIFLDQEEGGRLLATQMAYVLEWVETVNANGFNGGIYCSGMPAKEGKNTIITANDVHDHEGGRRITYFVYNDACPPSPGCALAKNPPSPTSSGVSFAAVWQFAQSPRRHEFTKSCSATYNADGNCYPPSNSATSISKQNAGIYLDLDSAMSPDPSNGR
jgi:Domain of unknown function (DUF1906)